MVDFNVWNRRTGGTHHRHVLKREGGPSSNQLHILPCTEKLALTLHVYKAYDL